MSVSTGKISSLKRDAAYAYGGHLLRYMNVLVLTPYYARTLGPGSYGTVLAAMSLMAMVWAIVNYGFSITGVRALASTPATMHGTIFGQQIMARAALLPVGVAVGVAATAASPTLSSAPWIAAAATALGLVNALNLGWFYQGLRRFRTSILLEAACYPMNILFILLLVRGEHDGLYAMVGMLLSRGIPTAWAYLLAARYVRPKAVSLSKCLREIKEASTIFLQSVNSMLMTAGATYMLGLFSSADQVGYFGSVEKLISFCLASLAPAGQLLMPTITHRSAHVSAEVSGLVRRAIMLESAYGVCTCIGGFALAPLIIKLAFGSQFAASIPIMRVVVFALPFAAFTHAFGLYVLIPQRREITLVSAVGAGNIISLLLMALLTRDFGGLGVSVARVAAELTAAVLLLLPWLRDHAFPVSALWNRRPKKGEREAAAVVGQLRQANASADLEAPYG